MFFFMYEEPQAWLFLLICLSLHKTIIIDKPHKSHYLEHWRVFQILAIHFRSLLEFKLDTGMLSFYYQDSFFKATRNKRIDINAQV